MKIEKKKSCVVSDDQNIANFDGLSRNISLSTNLKFQLNIIVEFIIIIIMIIIFPWNWKLQFPYQIGIHSARPFFQFRLWRAVSNLGGGVHLAFANHLI